MQQLSVVIITFNEENNIERCLRSVMNIADEIIVVDSLSTDSTELKCNQFNVRFIKHEWEGYSAQKNWADQQASNPYVLSLDADEALSDQLRNSILEEKKDWKYDSYSFNRHTNYCGKWINHSGWYPDCKIRLWNKEKGSWNGAAVHESIVMHRNASHKMIKGDLLHYSYTSIYQHIEQQNLFSEIAAKAAFEANVKSTVFMVLFSPLWKFIRNYIFKLGFLDGTYGFIVCSVASFSTFLKYIKLYHLKKEVLNDRKQALRFSYNPNIRVSLIISTYNRPDALELVIKSALIQSVFPDEIIIADDGSSDETKYLIDKYIAISPVPIIHCWHEDIGFRLAHIRNRAIAMSKGNYIVSIDGDVVMHKQFIKDHIDHTRQGYFIQGSRVLLLQEKTQKYLRNGSLNLYLYSSGISNRKNTVRHFFLARLFSSTSTTNSRGTRGCNMSFWKSDLLSINGFNEEYVGWGREDSDIVVRLYNKGVKRIKLKFSGLVFHLFHPENKNTEQLNRNDIVLQQTIDDKISWCKNGIDKYIN